MFGRTFNRNWLLVRNYVCFCFSESATEAKKEAKQEELEQLKPAIVSEEDHYWVIPILMTGDSTSELLPPIVDDPEFSAYSLKDSAGVDSIIKTLKVKNDNNIDKTFKLQFLDVSKKESFKFLRSRFKPHAKIIVYNATAIESFEKARIFLEGNGTNANGRVYMLLVGNNCDLDDNDERKVVKRGIAEELASMFGITFIETSANDPTNLERELLKMTKAYIESSKIYKTGAVQMKG